MRTLGLVAVFASTFAPRVEGQNNDLFNYYSSDRNENGITSRGQANWDRVRCGNDEICVRSKDTIGRAQGGNLTVFACTVLFIYRLVSPTNSLRCNKISPFINGNWIPWETIVNGVQRIVQNETVVCTDSPPLT